MVMLNVGFIGAGRISDLHALEYLANERARIVAVCDIDPQLAQSRGAQWGVAPDRIFTDYHALLALPDVDLVEILLPHHLRRQATLDAAAAGKHSSLQKAMALTVAEAGEMIAAAKQACVIFKVFENFIFYPPVQRAKALIEAGEIGDPLTIRIKSNSGTSPTMWDVPHAAWAWRYKPEECGGGPLSANSSAECSPIAMRPLKCNVLAVAKSVHSPSMAESTSLCSVPSVARRINSTRAWRRSMRPITNSGAAAVGVGSAPVSDSAGERSLVVAGLLRPMSVKL